MATEYVDFYNLLILRVIRCTTSTLIDLGSATPMKFVLPDPRDSLWSQVPSGSVAALSLGELGKCSASIDIVSGHRRGEFSHLRAYQRRRNVRACTVMRFQSYGTLAKGKGSVHVRRKFII